MAKVYFKLIQCCLLIAIGGIGGFWFHAYSIQDALNETNFKIDVSDVEDSNAFIKNTSVQVSKEVNKELQEDCKALKPSKETQPSIGNSFLSLLQIPFSRERKLSLLSNFSIFKKDELDNIVDLDQFALRLWEISSAESLLPEYEDAADEFGKVLFSAGNAFDERANANYFESTETSIFSKYTLPQYDGDSVLVKWYNETTGQTRLLKRIAIDPGKEVNYLWVNEYKGWDLGTYNVEIYSTEESLRLLAVGSYYVQ